MLAAMQESGMQPGAWSFHNAVYAFVRSGDVWGASMVFTDAQAAGTLLPLSHYQNKKIEHIIYHQKICAL